MTAILTNNFRLKQAELFLKAFESDPDKNIYLGIGRPNAWPDELNPTPPIDNITTIADCYATLMSLKKLSTSDVINVIPRFDWKTNTKFISYTNTDENLFLHPTQAELDAAELGSYIAGSFYCMNDEYRVYKCLKAGTGVSTVQPSLTILTPFETSDGYIWKYMFTIPTAMVDKYLTQGWIPVRFLSLDDGSSQWQVQQNAVAGSIESISILAGGSSYVKLFSGNVVSASGSTIQFDSAVGSTDLTNETVYIASGTGSGQYFKIQSYNTGTRTAVITGGTFSPVPTAASTYQIIPTLTMTGDGVNFKARCVFSGGTITNIIVTNAGSGYTFGNITLSTGSGYDLNANVSPLDGHGSNPIIELGGSYLMVSTILEYEEGSDVITDNDYRRYLLISNVNNPNGTVASALTLNALKSITISGDSGTFERDEIIQTSGGAKLIVVSIDAANNKIYYIQNSTTGTKTFTNSETILGLTSGATANISTLNVSEMQSSSGEILYIKHMRRVMRSSSLLEDIRILVKF